jgi:hypothetical protein
VAGRPNRGAKRRLTEELQALNRADAERRRVLTGDPQGKVPPKGKPFDSESARAARARQDELKRQKAEDEQREAEALAERLQRANLTEEDRALALERLRHLRDSPDEKVAATAATKLLDIYAKENQDHGPSVVRYESAFIDPEAT